MAGRKETASQLRNAVGPDANQPRWMAVLALQKCTELDDRVVGACGIAKNEGLCAWV